MIHLAINGASGRMGRRLIALGSQDPELTITSAVESKGHNDINKDAGVLSGIGQLNLLISESASTETDVLIDFTSPEGAAAATKYCDKNKVALVMASTGLAPETIEALRTASQSIPICWAPNMSLAVNLTMKLVETAAKALGQHSSGVDVEIIERHHRYKADSPSGTALKFGEIVANQMGQSEQRHGREGAVGERPQTEIGYHAIRSGDDPGQHTILFGMLGEKIELKVAASNRDCYALGALAAAKFLKGKQPGIYSMQDVLGLS